MIFDAKEVETIARGIVTGIAVVLLESDLTDKQIRRLRAHDLFADIMKSLYKQRKTFVEEARVMFRTGPEKYLQRKQRTP